MTEGTGTRGSAYVGKPLNTLNDIREDHHERLRGLGIQDAEQLLGIIAAMGGTAELAASTRLSAEDLNEIVEAARRAIPADVAALHSVAVPQDYPLGALPLDEATKAAIADHHRRFPPRVTRVGQELPPYTGHWTSMRPVCSQGSRLTCVGFGVSALREYKFWCDHDHDAHSVDIISLSEEFIYYYAKKLDGKPTVDGTTLFAGITALAQYGQCLEETLPYDPTPPTNHRDVITQAMLSEAKGYLSQAVYYSDPTDVTAMKTALAYTPANVAFCIPVYDSWRKSPTVAHSGQITMPLLNEKSVGGHCMCMVGYHDDPCFPGGGVFIARNSWGMNWADANYFSPGHATIPYSYIANYCTEAASY